MPSLQKKSKLQAFPWFYEDTQSYKKLKLSKLYRIGRKKET